MAESKEQSYRKTIYAALRTIRDVCLSSEKSGCINCPLCTEQGCKLAIDRPDKWHMTDEKEEIWRAFK